MRFHDPSWLWWLAAIPPLAAMSLWGVLRGARALRMFISPRLVDRRPISAARRRVLFLAAAAALVMTALARPQYGVRPIQITRSGIDVMILLDTSKSMAAADIKPSRIERAKNEIRKLISALEGDRIGLIAFAGASFVECPLTLDTGAVRMFLDALGAGSIPVPGTAIGEALRDAIKAFKTSNALTKAVILITDGENLQGDAQKAAMEAREAGLTIFTIGVGSEAGAPVPEIDATGKITGYKTDERGEPVITRLDAAVLRDIALAGAGAFYASQGGALDLSGLVETLEKMEKTDITSQQFTEYEERYQPLALAALALISLEALLSWRLSPRARRAQSRSSAV